jgi:hypothetical protein
MAYQPLPEDKNYVLDTLPAQVLLDVARNESAPYEWRKAAVRLMKKKGYDKQASHPDLVLFVRELEKEEQAEKEVISVVESAIEGDIDGDPDHGDKA